MINKTIWYIGGSLFSLIPSIHAQQKSPRPNIVFIMMDDLGYGDIGCYGQQKIETPNIDELCRQGMKFTQAYSGSPVSAAARCVLMTGMHTGHSQIRGNDEYAVRGATSNYDSMYVHKELEGQYPLKKESMTLGKMMQQAGYVTGCFGKWGLGYPTSDGTPDKQGFDKFYGYNCQRQAHTYYPPFLYNNNERVYLQNKVSNPHAGLLDKKLDPYNPHSYDQYQQKEYANDLIFTALIDFVESHKSSPFFIMWTTPLPHVSLQAPEHWVRYYVEKFGDEEPYIGQKGYMPCRYPHATYAAMISYFDEQIGNLVEKLKDDGLYENTLIVFTSDNGPTFNGGSDSPWFNSGGLFKSERGWGKCYLHEGGIRIPAIISWPGVIKANTVSNHIFSFQDYMPTFADVVNITSPQSDGISIYPTLMGKGKQKKHKFLYWEYPDQDGERAVLYGKWKGLLRDIKKGNTKVELFDLEKDIQELNDVSSKYPNIVKRIEKMMKDSSIEPENKKFKM